MNNQLIQTTTALLNGDMQSVIDARELHAFLDSKQLFNDWFNHRVQTYGFVKNTDYIKLCNWVGMGSFDNPQRKKDYGLSIDMAKELAMLERNEKGRQARRYFIAMENSAKQGLINQSLLVDALIKAKPEWMKLKRYRELGLNNVEIAKLTDRHPRTVRRSMSKLISLGIISQSPKAVNNQLALTLEA